MGVPAAGDDQRRHRRPVRADHIYTEVYRRLPKIARSSPAPLDTLREGFEAEYLPALRHFTVDFPEWHPRLFAGICI
jgi:hypothetical protein